MRRFLILFVVLSISGVAFGQNNTIQNDLKTGSETEALQKGDVESALKSSLELARKAAAIDTTLEGMSIFAVVSDNEGLAGSVTITQSASLQKAMDNHIANNAKKVITGYRVRIYFDNTQSARSRSESIASAFSAAYPGVSVYRTHVSPYFKVAVGDFRTKADASKFAKELEGKYPSAFIVKEAINYPIESTHNPL